MHPSLRGGSPAVGKLAILESKKEVFVAPWWPKLELLDQNFSQAVILTQETWGPSCLSGEIRPKSFFLGHLVAKICTVLCCNGLFWRAHNTVAISGPSGPRQKFLSCFSIGRWVGRSSKTENWFFLPFSNSKLDEWEKV